MLTHHCSFHGKNQQIVNQLIVETLGLRKMRLKLSFQLTCFSMYSILTPTSNHLVFHLKWTNSWATSLACSLWRFSSRLEYCSRYSKTRKELDKLMKEWKILKLSYSHMRFFFSESRQCSEKYALNVWHIHNFCKNQWNSCLKRS